MTSRGCLFWGYAPVGAAPSLRLYRPTFGLAIGDCINRNWKRATLANYEMDDIGRCFVMVEHEADIQTTLIGQPCGQQLQALESRRGLNSRSTSMPLLTRLEAIRRKDFG
jgi:hypothetical protein